MINHFAFCIGTANTWTRISTMLIETRKMIVAVLVHDTFRFATVHVWVSNKWWNTLAFSNAVLLDTDRVLPARN